MQSEDMQFEYDPEKLIEEVRKRPGIWDSENPDYRGKHTRHQLWIEVVREMLNTDTKVSKSELRELELQLQKKWKSIKDCFQKYVQNPMRTKRPYIYTKHLQFLLKKNELPAHDGSSESEEVLPQPRIKKVWKTKTKLKLSNPEQSSEEDNDDNGDQEVYLDTNFTNEPEEGEVPLKIARTSNPKEFAFANVDAPYKSDEDPDKLFLLSLLPHLKSIPEEFRLNVKMDLMQVLKNANYISTRDHKLL